MGTRIFRRRPLAQHGQQSTPSAWGQLLTFIGLGLAVVLVSASSVVAYFAYDFTSTLEDNSFTLEGSENAPPSISGYEGGFNILVVGIDQCEAEYAYLFPGRCEQEGDNSQLNDVNILLHVSAEPRRVTAVSFPRDLQLSIPECTRADGSTVSAMRKQALNVTYPNAGLPCVASTITELTGQSVDFAARFTFGGVIQMTDAVGGVEVCLASPIKDSHTQLDLAAGNHTLQGYWALQFLRTRHGLQSGSDIARIGNQQQFMSSLARKILGEGVLSDVPTLLRLASTAVNALQVDDRLANPMMIVELALALKDVAIDDIVFLQYPTLTDPENANHLVSDDAAAEAMWEAINSNQPLEVTHVSDSVDGVVVEGGEDPGQEVTGGETESPQEGTIALPEAVRGAVASTDTCSNGVIYD